MQLLSSAKGCRGGGGDIGLIPFQRKRTKKFSAFICLLDQTIHEGGVDFPVPTSFLSDKPEPNKETLPPKEVYLFFFSFEDEQSIGCLSNSTSRYFPQQVHRERWICFLFSLMHFCLILFYGVGFLYSSFSFLGFLY